MKKHLFFKKCGAALWVIAILAAFSAFMLWQNNSLSVEEYTFSSARLPAGFDGCRIVQLSDLHGKQFGADNRRLVMAVKACRPDYIAITGDLADERSGTDFAPALLRALTDIAPTYYVSGNHEWAARLFPAFCDVLRDAGVVYLNNTYTVLRRNGDSLVLSGVDDPNGYADQKTPAQLAAEIAAEEGDPFWLLLAHRNSEYGVYGNIGRRSHSLRPCPRRHYPPAGDRRSAGHWRAVFPGVDQRVLPGLSNAAVCLPGTGRLYPHSPVFEPAGGGGFDFTIRIEVFTMKEFLAGRFDVAVIGAGHAGIEAALASARLGLETVCFTINLDAVGNMPCNPAIGGTGKGHLVRELDALGGEMARAADKACIQYRLLNRGKGPAVHSLRAQADRRTYQRVMKHTLESQAHLALRQAEVTAIRQKNGRVTQVVLRTGAVFDVGAVVVATGTYLRGRTIVGECVEDSGPDGMHPALQLTQSLADMGLELRRFKTGTPPRVNARSIDFSQMEEQPGDEVPVPFSFTTEHPPVNRAVCYLTYTTPRTHEIILENLNRSPIFSGVIEGIGPRYCPSIETKIVRFRDKPRHQLFIEPMGLDTEEMYIQGFSSSMPEEVQVQMLHSVPGLEKAEIMRPAYAIEYDCVNPLELRPTLETKKIEGLYGAGQFNGSSGYEEAAVQGFAAGVNAALKLKGQPPMILSRSESYIGTLIDDLVTKGTDEPYRIMTSRSEYRLLLRQDNADARMTPIGHALGLISDERYAVFMEKQAAITAEIARIRGTALSPSEALNALLMEAGGAPIAHPLRMADLLRRPKVTYEALAPFDPSRPDLSRDIVEEAEIQIKYEGYIEKQQQELERAAKLENLRLPEGLDFIGMEGLRLEARQKLARVKPATVGQAGRISGVSPADIAVLLVYLEKKRR